MKKEKTNMKTPFLGCAYYPEDWDERFIQDDISKMKLAGIKCARILLLLKGVRRNISQIMHPQKVQVVRVNGKPVDERILSNTNSYLAIYVTIIVVSFLVLGLDNFSMTTNFSAVMACFNNIGPGLSSVGPMYSYAEYSALSKIVLSIAMLLGRLEIYPIIITLTLTTWKKKK